MPDFTTTLTDFSAWTFTVNASATGGITVFASYPQETWSAHSPLTTFENMGVTPGYVVSKITCQVTLELVTPLSIMAVDVALFMVDSAFDFTNHNEIARDLVGIGLANIKGAGNVGYNAFHTFTPPSRILPSTLASNTQFAMVLSTPFYLTLFASYAGHIVLSSLVITITADVPSQTSSSTISSSPFALDGTQIEDIDTDTKALSARTHRLSAFTENPVELWYYRDTHWHLFPIQPLTGPQSGLQLTQTYKQPYTLQFTLPDPMGLYASENRTSPYNKNAAGAYDALLDEARKICLRIGTHCYRNLAAGILPTTDCTSIVGSLSKLTDGVLGDIAIGSDEYVQFLNNPFSITIDLGSLQSLRHAVIRFASKAAVYPLSTGTCCLPSSIILSISINGSDWMSFPPRPAGNQGAGVVTLGEAQGFTPGDWSESTIGETIEFAFCDLQKQARYVKFTTTVAPEPPALAGDGSWHINFIDEIAIYGGDSFVVLGANIFTGYMGDLIDFTPQGSIKCTAIDVMKKLADNNDVFLTAPYKITSAGGIELADIVYSLLTANSYWVGYSEYNKPFLSTEIGWPNRSDLTGLRYPLWQGQSNSIYGYCQELFGVIGWNFYADGNGVLQATEPPYRQRLPDRVCISGEDGNYDVANCQRHRTGKQMRNKVIVQTGKSKATGSGTITLSEPNSIARYGTRTTRITDPLASTTQFRLKVADYFLRDYAWNLQTLSNTIRPQFETKLKQVFAFRAPARPNLFAATTNDSVAFYVPDKERSAELWSLTSITHNITYGQWTADCEWIPYIAQGPIPPDLTALSTPGAFPHNFTLTYTPLDGSSQPPIAAMNVYLSTQGSYAGFTLFDTINAFGSQLNGGIGAFNAGFLTYAGLGTNPALDAGEQIYVYLTYVDVNGIESLPSQILGSVLGSSAETLICYTITDFSVSSISTSDIDAHGYYTYSFLCLWTSPECGFTQSHIGAFVGDRPPSDPDKISSWPITDDSWSWWAPDRIASGRTWDNTTFGQLDFVINFRSTSNLSGQTVYFRIWNSARTRAWIPVEGNYALCTVM